jgi:uncharacterized protein YggE
MLVAVLALLSVTGCSDDNSHAAGAAVAVSAVGGVSAGTHPLGLTVTGRGSVTVAADHAFVVGVPSEPAISNEQSSDVSRRERDDLTRALRALDIGANAAAFSRGQGVFGSATIVRVEVPLRSLHEKARAVGRAINENIHNVGTTGVRFTLDDCAGPRGDAQVKALVSAHEWAKRLANVADVRLGRLLQAGDPAVDLANYSPYSVADDPCLPDGGLGPYGPQVQPLDAKPRVTLDISVQATYEIKRRPATAGFNVTTTGRATAPADEAYVVVSPDSFDPSRAADGQSNAAEVARALADLGISAKDVEVVNRAAAFGAPIVTVEVDANKVAALGPRIANKVNSLLGGSGDSRLSVGGTGTGVRFETSRCEEVVERAWKQALTDANRRVETLADGAKVSLGDATGIMSLGSPVSGVTISSGSTPCEDVDSSSIGSLVGLQQLESFDAKPIAKIEVSVAITRPIKR